MQTQFSDVQLANPQTAVAEAVIRKCVHCGLCTATCPTYVLLGDELDSPRGRIYLMKDMLENQRQPSAEVVKHVDRCLSCLACMTTCPSDVNYMHLVDHARAYIEENHTRPLPERLIRHLLAAVLPYPRRFRFALRLARLTSWSAPLFNKFRSSRPLGAMLSLAPRRIPRMAETSNTTLASARGRVALMQGCAEPVLKPEFRAAAVRLLGRVGFDVVFAPNEQCCGALVHHMGQDANALDAARNNVDAWTHVLEDGGLDAIIVTASGCGSTVKDYGFMLRNDADYADNAARVSELAVDISEFLSRRELPEHDGRGVTVAYHSACSLQHGQKVTDAPKRLLAAAGYRVTTPAESHLCCGSAGVYNVLQPDIARQLGDRKTEQLSRLKADVIATGNIGCAIQIGTRTSTPVVHTIELLDWASGGPKPTALEESGQ